MGTRGCVAALLGLWALGVPWFAAAQDGAALEREPGARAWEGPEERRVEPVETDLWTVLSIGVTVYTLTALTHEAFGHEGACLLAGEKPEGFSLGIAGCSEGKTLTRGDNALVSAGGALANALHGGGAVAMLSLSPPDDGAAYYYWWLTGATNLFAASGYLLAGPWVPEGDFNTRTGVLAGLDPELGWQIGVSALGAAMTFGSLFLMNDLAEPLLGRDPDLRSDRRLNLTLWPYLVGAGLLTASAALTRFDDSGPVVLSAAVGNFAGTLFLGYMPLFFTDDVFYPSVEDSPDRPLSIGPDPTWMAVGTAAALTAIFVFGPGLGNFPQEHPFDPF